MMRQRGVLRGQALVELALVLPLLLVLLMSVVEFGFYFYTLANINNAVRLGARAGASTALTDARVNTIVSASLGFQAPAASITLYEFTPATVTANATTTSALPPPSADVPGHPRTNGDFLVVQVSIPYQSLTRLVDLQALGGISRYSDYSTFLINH